MKIAAIILIIIALVDMVFACYVCTRNERTKQEIILSLFMSLAGLIALFMGLAVIIL